jgi:hypothetical protein
MTTGSTTGLTKPTATITTPHLAVLPIFPPPLLSPPHIHTPCCRCALLLLLLRLHQVVPDRAPPGGVWKVTPRWVVDSERYNEWMNPADYSTPEAEAEMEAADAAVCVCCVRHGALGGGGGEIERVRVLGVHAHTLA